MLFNFRKYYLVNVNFLKFFYAFFFHFFHESLNVNVVSYCIYFINNLIKSNKVDVKLYKRYNILLK